MATKKFVDLIKDMLFENGDVQKGERNPDPEVTEEEMARFGENVGTEDTGASEKAWKIITDSQYESDNDGLPDISIVQSVLDNAGESANPELVSKIIKNLMQLNPDEVRQDGLVRKGAVQNALDRICQQTEIFKTQKKEEEEQLKATEAATETNCEAGIKKVNTECVRAIEEERKRSAEAIAKLEQCADAEISRLREEKRNSLDEIANQRSNNEKAVAKAEELCLETQKKGQQVISQIEKWISYLN